MYICVDPFNMNKEMRLDLLSWEIKSPSKLKSIIGVKKWGTVLEWNESEDLADKVCLKSMIVKITPFKILKL